MTKLINSIWENVKIAAEFMIQSDNRISFDDNKKENFKEFFDYNLEIVKNYMFDSKENLDRHKIAAIIIISILKVSPLKSSGDEENNIFVGNYVLATEIALSYMREQLNEILLEQHEQTISKYFFPDSWTCKNNYFRVFYRNLYFADKNSDWGLNPLDIAERLFLLEYITLLKQGIDVHKLETYN